MHAVTVTPDRGLIELREHPRPMITREDDVDLDIIDVGVCGTDREIASFHPECVACRAGRQDFCYTGDASAASGGRMATSPTCGRSRRVFPGRLAIGDPRSAGLVRDTVAHTTAHRGPRESRSSS